MYKTTGIYISEDIDREIKSRGSNRSQVICRDLERLYALYKRAVKEVPLTYAEVCLIVDVLNSALMDANSARMLWAEIEDACKLDGMDKRWEVDGPALVEKLKGLSTFHCMALIDAAECFWNLPDKERDLTKVRVFFNVVD